MPFVILVLIAYLLSVILSVALGLAVSGFNLWRSAVKLALTAALPLGYLMLAAAFVLLMLGIKNDATSLYNPVAYSLGGASAVITIAGWMERIFSKSPLSQDRFEQGLLEQTERLECSQKRQTQRLEDSIVNQTEILQATNSELVELLAETNRLVSGLSDDIRASLELRPATGDGICASDDGES